jgi:putative oxidoreductase
MKFTSWYPLEANDKRLSTALLLVRLIFGVAMAYHGFPKLQHMTTWMGPDTGIPTIFIALAAIAESIGGIAIALGALTPVAAFGNACTMLVAALYHISKGDPFVAKGGGGSWELAGVYLVLSIALMLTGPGRFSLDAIITKKWRS